MSGRGRGGPALSVVPTEEEKNVAQQEASDAARLAKRFVLLELDNNFDDARHRYKPGHSDATVAKQAGVSEELVKRLRVEFYGEMAPPSEVEGLQEQIAQIEKRLETAVTTAMNELTAMRERLEDLIRKNCWKR